MKTRALSLLLAFGLLSVSPTVWGVKKTMDVVHLERTTKDGVALSTYGKIVSEDNLTVRMKRFDGGILEYDKSLIQGIERGGEVDVPEWTAKVMDQVEAAERAPSTESGVENGGSPSGSPGVKLSSFDKPTAQIEVKSVRKDPEGGLDLMIGLEWSGPPPASDQPPIPVLFVIELPKQTTATPAFTLNTKLYGETMRGFLRRLIAVIVDLRPQFPAMMAATPDQVPAMASPLIDLFCDPRMEFVVDVDTCLQSLPNIARGALAEFFNSPAAPLLAGQLGDMDVARKQAEDAITRIPVGLTLDGLMADVYGSDEFKSLSTTADLSGIEKTASFLKEHILLIRVLPLQSSLPANAAFKGVGRFLTGSGKAKAYVVYPEPSPETQMQLMGGVMAAQMSGDSERAIGILPDAMKASREVFSPASNVIDIQF
jgi:hypothetical protein